MISAIPDLSSAPRRVVPSVVIKVWPGYFSKLLKSAGSSLKPEFPSSITPPS